MAGTVAMPPLQPDAAGTFVQKNVWHNSPKYDPWGDRPPRYGTSRATEHHKVFLGTEASSLGRSNLDEITLTMARERALDTGRAVAIVDAADGGLATRPVAVKTSTYGDHWAANLRVGNHANRLAMDDTTVRAIVNAGDDFVIGARPHSSKLANLAFRATRTQAAQIGLATLAGVSMLHATMLHDPANDGSGIRPVVIGEIAASAAIGAGLVAAAVAGRGNAVHNTKWMGMGGAAMLAAAGGGAAIVASASER